MKPDNPLHQLIHALSPSEKRYVRIFASRHTESQSPRYVALFDYLSRHHTVNEKDLLHELYPGKTRNAFASEKNYLFNTILDGMRLYHRERTVDMSISESIADAGFLFSKRLYDESFESLQRARKLAEACERWSALVEIVKMECEIIKEKKHNGMQKELAANARMLEQYLSCQAEDAQFKIRRDQLFVSVRRGEPHEADNTELNYWSAIFHQTGFRYTRFNVQYYTLSALYMILYRQGVYAEVYPYSLMLMKLWDDFPVRKDADRLLYSKVFANALNIALLSGNFDQLRSWLMEYEKLETSTPEEEAEKFQNDTFIRLLLMVNTTDFSGLEQLVGEIGKGLKHYKTKINKAREIAFYHNIAIAYFICNDFKESLSWCNRIILNEKTDHRKDIQNLARLLRLILYYELDKADLLEYEIINAERFLRQRKAWTNWEASFCRLLKKLIIADSNESRKLFTQFLENADTADQHKNKHQLPLYVELILWAKHHTTGKSLQELLREQSPSH